uniref:Tyrosine-protein kinase ephrin type A/B receptor-like domain-containing protein n=1 Tax=Phaeomonas parva TaxID=124430 RepID=A0A7S1XJ19_9STRA
MAASAAAHGLHGHGHGHHHDHDHGNAVDHDEHDYRHLTEIHGQGHCGTPDLADEGEARRLSLPNHHEQVVKHVFGHKAEEQPGRRRLGAYDIHEVVFPKMVYHVVQNTNGDGVVADSFLQAQHDVLNAALAPYIRIDAWERNDIIDDNYYTNGCNRDQGAVYEEMRSLYTDTTALNTYLMDCLTYGLGGFAVFPWEYEEDSFMHAVALDYRTLPDYPLPPGWTVCTGGCMGHIQAHEWGHAFGLFHTFAQISTASGHVVDDVCDCTWNDLVSDTPVANVEGFGGGPDAASCQAHHDSHNSCDEGPGDQNDATNNYMHYSDDVCMEEFTEGQFFRMLYIIAKTKPNLVASMPSSSHSAGCTPGFMWDAGSADCIQCPDGTYQDEWGATSCKSCPEEVHDRWEVMTGPTYEGYGLWDGFNTYVTQCYEYAGCASSVFSDGACHGVNNNARCWFDGGDCCPDCCYANCGLDSSACLYTCGQADYTEGLSFGDCTDATCLNSDPNMPWAQAATAAPAAGQCLAITDTILEITPSPTAMPTFPPEPTMAPTKMPTVMDTTAPTPMPTEAVATPPPVPQSTPPPVPQSTPPPVPAETAPPTMMEWGGHCASDAECPAGQYCKFPGSDDPPMDTAARRLSEKHRSHSHSSAFRRRRGRSLQFISNGICTPVGM